MELGKPPGNSREVHSPVARKTRGRRQYEQNTRARAPHQDVVLPSRLGITEEMQLWSEIHPKWEDRGWEIVPDFYLPAHLLSPAPMSHWPNLTASWLAKELRKCSWQESAPPYTEQSARMVGGTDHRAKRATRSPSVTHDCHKTCMSRSGRARLPKRDLLWETTSLRRPGPDVEQYQPFTWTQQ